MSDNKKPIERELDEGTASVMFIVALVWILMGVSAFIISLWCFKYSSGKDQFLYNIFGFLVAITLGPFYWIYYAVNSSYCKTLPNVSA